MTPQTLVIYAMPLYAVVFASDGYNAQKYFMAAFLAFIGAFKNGFGSTNIDRYILAFGAALLLAVGFSHFPTLSALGQYRAYISGLLPLCVVGMHFYLSAGSDSSTEDLERHVVTAGLISSVWAIVQFCAQGEAGGFILPHGLSEGRPYAGFGSTVYLGAFLALCLPLAVAKGWHKRAGVIFVALLLTKTRSALLGAALGMFVWAWLSNRLKKSLLVASAVVLALSLGVITALRADPVLADRGRLMLYQGAWNTIKAHPLTGYGPDMFLDAFARYRPPEWTKFYKSYQGQGSAHNDILGAAVDGGIPLMLAYLALVGAIARALFLSGNYAVAGAMAALFTYAKLNETPLAVKVVAAILLGSALASGRIGSTSAPKISGLLLATLTWALVFHDRILMWGQSLGSENLMGYAFRFFGALE